MAHAHASPGTPLDLNSFGEGKTAAIVKTPEFEVIRLVAKSGKPIPPHKVEGPITVQCLEGTCTFSVGDEPHVLSSGSWLFLEGGVLHAVESNETCVLLVTILFRGAPAM